MSKDIGVWVAALLTLAILSFLYRENPVYRVAEHLLVGVATAYSVLALFYTVFMPVVWDGLRQPKDGGSMAWTLLFTVLGLLFLAPFAPKLGWLARIPAAIAIGYAAGQELPAAVQARLYPQLASTITLGGTDVWSILNSLLILVGTFAVLFYFMMTLRAEPVTSGVTQVGIIFLMLGFGAVFGNMVISRFTILIGRVQFLFGTWVHLIPPS